MKTATSKLPFDERAYHCLRFFVFHLESELEPRDLEEARQKIAWHPVFAKELETCRNLVIEWETAHPGYWSDEAINSRALLARLAKEGV